jgi:hypothetical protein
MRLTITLYTLLGVATPVALAAPAPAPSPQVIVTPQEPTTCQKAPAGYFCATGINGPDSIVQCNPNPSDGRGDWLFIGRCGANEYCWEDWKGQAFCRRKSQ